ncbi:glycerophosphodiester phosphodiesterase [Microvirga puerhi]|uniref:GP-PDE domain-containing protein n=1 Tax=Microvirga puerhi TaxID=2876078 RepID=A0ABS7VSY1_9HYPH|nr:glycerophosphodiester phosphodiesterase family protein [Microvirga puerhi]MBZ6078677.1 hypothetical protein [Microvirga puerhi]
MPPSSTKIASHRGGAELWPENSRLAFRNSMKLPVDFIEFDLHRSRDGVLLVHHDPILGRTSEGEGVIAEMPWDRLKVCRLRRTDGEGLPTFAEVLDIVTTRRMGLRIELKDMVDGNRYEDMEAQTVAALEERGLLDRVTFTSFNLDTLRVLASLRRNLPLIWLIKTDTYEAEAGGLTSYCERALAAGVSELSLRIEQMVDGDVDFCRARGLSFGVFAAHTTEAIMRAFKQSVAAFTTDRPDLAIDVRDQYAKIAG